MSLLAHLLLISFTLVKSFGRTWLFVQHIIANNASKISVLILFIYLINSEESPYVFLYS